MGRAVASAESQQGRNIWPCPEEMITKSEIPRQAAVSECSSLLTVGVECGVGVVVVQGLRLSQAG